MTAIQKKIGTDNLSQIGMVKGIGMVKVSTERVPRNSPVGNVRATIAQDCTPEKSCQASRR